MKYQFSICRTISTVAIIFILVRIISAASSSQIFLNIRPLFIPIGLCFFMMLAVYEIEFLKFIPHTLRILFCKPLEPNPRLAQIALFGSRSAIGAGLIEMLVALIQMLRNLSDPSGIGIGMAASLICPFYAIVISELFFGIVYQTFKNTQIKAKDIDTLPLTNVGLPLITILFLLSIFFIRSFTFFSFESMNY